VKNISVVQPMGVSEQLLSRLRSLGHVSYYNTVCNDGADWLERVAGADIILTNFSGFNEAWRSVNNVFITLSFVGYGFLDIEMLKQNQVLIADSPGCNQIAVTEWIVAMLINYSRNLTQAIGMTVEPYEAPIGRSLSGKSVCIVGKGNIGSRAGRMLVAMGMKVNYFTRGDNLADKIRGADFIIKLVAN
jgi:phosphoglycerate dehydrogenase-like enzyme